MPSSGLCYSILQNIELYLHIFPGWPADSARPVSCSGRQPADAELELHLERVSVWLLLSRK